MPDFHVPDIHCDACIHALTTAVRDLDSRATLQADLTTKRVHIETTASQAAVAAAIQDAGFTVDPT